VPLYREEYADIHSVCVFCNGDATATLEEFQQRTLDGESPTETSLLAVNSTGEKEAPFRAQNSVLEFKKVNRNLEEDENIGAVVQRSTRTSTQRISALFNVPHKGIQ
jgi:hypothetical protein